MLKEQHNNELFLRPRFRFLVTKDRDTVMTIFKEKLQNSSTEHPSYFVDNHIVINIQKKDNHFWSPQLNVEIEPINEHECVIKGLFGPKPQVWTLFIFIHFIVASLFIVFGVITYVKWSLGVSFAFPLSMIFLLPFIWTILYFLGRIGKSTGEKQMQQLKELLKTILIEKT